MRTLLLLVTALTACGGPSDSPNATVTGATPEELVASDDALNDITITVDFDDGDGDLGTGTAEVFDCRADGLVTKLPLPAIAPEGRVGDHISGTLELHVNDVGFIAPDVQPAVCSELGVASLTASETVFCVVLVDVKGHRGDGDCTKTITLYE